MINDYEKLKKMVEEVAVPHGYEAPRFYYRQGGVVYDHHSKYPIIFNKTFLEACFGDKWQAEGINVLKAIWGKTSPISYLYDRLFGENKDVPAKRVVRVGRKIAEKTVEVG